MAKFKYDVELFITDIEKVFKDNLNTCIDAINLEKQTLTPETNDNFNIARISDDAWYFNHIPTIWSYPQMIIWGIEDITILNKQADGASQKVTAFFEVGIPDKGDVINQSYIYKLLRYSRALQDIALKNFDGIRSYGHVQVESLSPALVSISDKKLRISGINISATFGLR
jgi:hypothetical protein